MAALRAAVFGQSGKNRREGSQQPPPPSRAKVNPCPHMLFPHPRTHMGDATSRAISPLIEIELWDKTKNPWDILSPTVPESRPRSYLTNQRSQTLETFDESYKRLTVNTATRRFNKYEQIVRISLKLVVEQKIKYDVNSR